MGRVKGSNKVTAFVPVKACSPTPFLTLMRVHRPCTCLLQQWNYLWVQMLSTFGKCKKKRVSKFFSVFVLRHSYLCKMFPHCVYVCVLSTLCPVSRALISPKFHILELTDLTPCSVELRSHKLEILCGLWTYLLVQSLNSIRTVWSVRSDWKSCFASPFTLTNCFLALYLFYWC